MARSSRAAVALLLLACLAAAALAAPHHPRHSKRHSRYGEEAELEEAAEPYEREEEAFMEAEEGDADEAAPAQGGLYDCPDVPKMRGCASSGCVLHSHKRATYLICNECASEKAYVLQNAGTLKAACECAPGYAGKGQDGTCKKCPAETDLAEGGPIKTSVCLRCPKGTIVSDDGTDCLCPAGAYRVSADQEPGFKRVACKACEARTAYVSDELHARDSCSACKSPQVANKDHTKCVDAQSPDASEMPEGLLKSVTQRAETTFGSLASAFNEGRQQGAEQRLKRAAGITEHVTEVKPPGVFKSLSKRMTSLTKTVEDRLAGKPADSKDSEESKDTYESARAEEEEEEYDQGEEDDSAQLHSVSSKAGKHSSSSKGGKHSSKPSYEADKHTHKGSKGYKKGGSKKDAEEEEGESYEAEGKGDSKKEQRAKKREAKAEQMTERKEAQAVKSQQAAAEKYVSPTLAQQLIPGVPTEAEQQQQQAAATDAAKQAPAAPPSPLRDLMKGIGSALGGAAPVRDPDMPSGMLGGGGFGAGLAGRLDPEALADAGLPPVTNVGGLMGALMKRQFSDLDTSDWASGIRTGGGAPLRAAQRIA